MIATLLLAGAVVAAAGVVALHQASLDRRRSYVGAAMLVGGVLVATASLWGLS